MIYEVLKKARKEFPKFNFFVDDLGNIEAIYRDKNIFITRYSDANEGAWQSILDFTEAVKSFEAKDDLFLAVQLATEALKNINDGPEHYLQQIFYALGYWGIRDARKAAGLSKAEMARRFNIPLRTLENWESGARVPAPWAEALITEKLNKIKEGQD